MFRLVMSREKHLKVITHDGHNLFIQENKFRKKISIVSQVYVLQYFKES